MRPSPVRPLPGPPGRNRHSRGARAAGPDRARPRPAWDRTPDRAPDREEAGKSPRPAPRPRAAPALHRSVRPARLRGAARPAGPAARGGPAAGGNRSAAAARPALRETTPPRPPRRSRGSPALPRHGRAREAAPRTSLAQRPHRAAAGDRRKSGSSPLAHRPHAHRPGRQGGGGRQPCAHRSSRCGARRPPPAWRRGQGWAFHPPARPVPPARSPGPARRTRPTTARPPRRRNPGRNGQGKPSRANRRTAGRYRAKPVSTPARSTWAARHARFEDHHSLPQPRSLCACRRANPHPNRQQSPSSSTSHKAGNPQEEATARPGRRRRGEQTIYRSSGAVGKSSSNYCKFNAAGTSCCSLSLI